MNHSDIDDRHARIASLVDVKALMIKRILIVGAGSMGQLILNQLARHGVATKPPGRITMIDGDTVEPRNLIGTEYRTEHLGKPKVEAAARIVHEINESINISYWHTFLTEEDIPEIVKRAQHVDLVGLFADSFELMLQISQQCYPICPIVMAIFGPRADFAEAAFSIPQATPPLTQTLGRRRRQTISNPTALGCDTAFIANFVAALCLRLLLGEAQGKELFECYADAPLFLIGLRKSWLFSNQPADVARTVFHVKV